jgi:RAD51-like protein 2
LLGSGKTQLCMQLAVSVQLPTVCGGCDGECIYIDTEGSFLLQRVRQIADHSLQHLNDILPSQQSQQTASQYSLEKLLNGIHYYRAGCASQQLAILRCLPNLLQQNKRIRLIVIDSISAHFRFDFHEKKERSRILFGMGQNLNQLCAHFSVAIVWVNHLAVKITPGSFPDLVPALGENWGHLPSHRLRLHCTNNGYFAELLKSSFEPYAFAPFSILSEGIRDIPSDYPQSQSQSQSQSQFQSQTITGSTQPSLDDI